MKSMLFETLRQSPTLSNFKRFLRFVHTENVTPRQNLPGTTKVTKKQGTKNKISSRENYKQKDNPGGRTHLNLPGFSRKSRT